MYKRNKKRVRKGTVLFLLFLGILLLFMLWVSEQYLRNSEEVLRQTEYIERMEGKK